MAEPFKNLFNQKFFDAFTILVLKVVPEFDKNSFMKGIFDDEWESRELKQRMRHSTITLKNHLSGSFEDNAKIILKIIDYSEKSNKVENLGNLVFADFIEIYGLDSFETSVNAFEKITQLVSCEFAVRPFIIEYPEKMIPQMLEWSKHKNPMVRRLSSEGCRPRLPWGMAIPALKKDPTPILPILENLKNDESESVRKSVANNLNDIAKDNPNTVISIAKKWQYKTPETDWLIKHGCRTLLKQGIPEVMEMFGFGSVKNINVDQFKILTPKVKIGDSVEFTFKLANNNNSTTLIRLEYGLYYQKANGSLSKKVFKISEKDYAKNSTITISRKQSFRIITTRVFHVGLHQVSIIINGVEFEKHDFELIKQ